MPSYNPVIKNGADGAIFYVSLLPRTPTGGYQANPTLAAGDVKIAIDDGAPANLATLPAVDADFTKRVKVTLSQAETNGDNLTVLFVDAAGGEWNDCRIDIQTVSGNLDSIKTVVDSNATKLDTIDDLLDTEIAAILADTNELQTDWANGGRLDLILDAIPTTDVSSDVTAIKAKTDSLTFTVAGQVDANIESVNTTAVTGSGTEGDPWGP